MSQELNGDAGSAPARKLADILAEAGVSAVGAGGRRRRRDETPDPVAEVEGEFGGLSAYLLAAPDLYAVPQIPAIQAPTPRPLAARPLEPQPLDPRPPERRPLDPRPPERRLTEQRPTEQRPTEQNALPRRDATRSRVEVPRTDTGPVTPFGWAARSEEKPTSTGPDATSSSASPADSGIASSSGSTHGLRTPSALASSPPDDPEEEDSALPLRGGATSWAILAVELLAALGLGVAAWYAFSALWELLPYVAAFAGPLVVTGLVAVAGALRARTGRNPLGLPTLCILVFAGTVLVVLPAATVIVP